jgi:uncharacterized protein YdhG (YjbR/CyaY superfamily)
MTSSASTTAEYLASITDWRQEPLQQLTQIFRDNLPKGFEETMLYGMINFVVPHSIFPAGYHCNPKDPVSFVAIAAQKNSVNVYHMGLYMEPALLTWFQEAFAARGIKLDMGKSCIRFSKTTTVPYDILAELARKISVEQYLTLYTNNLSTKKS